MSDQKSPAAAAEGGEGEHVLIIGAGVTGLLIAHGLKQAGVPFTIFDAEPNATARKREWTMIMHW